MEKLYLKGWQYNTYLIINELYKIIKENGGKIVNDSPYINTYHKKEIVNRSILENMEDCRKYLQNKTKEEIKNNQFLIKKQKELEKLEKIENEPKQVIFTNYINFYLDGFIYYIQLQDNPYFDDYIQKERTEKTGKGYTVQYNYYMENLSKKWIDEYKSITSYYQTLTKRQTKELAKRLFEQIINAPASEIVTNKRRMQNHYDNRYHYEYIKEQKNKMYQVLEKME